MTDRRISFFGQIQVYLGKCFRLFLHEKQWKLFLSTLIIVLIISLVTGPDMFKEYGPTNKGAFAIVSACIWSGLFNSIQSICRERAIIKREYRTGLRISAYILAHAIYEMLLCFAEALIVLIVLYIRNHSHLPESGLVFFRGMDLYITLFLIIFSSDMMAMLVSSIVRTENTAMMIMPFILVIQLVMSGVIFELKGFVEILSRYTISKWGVNGLVAIARTNETVDQQAVLAEITGSDPEVMTMLGCWTILFAFCIVYIILAILFLRRVDKDQR